MSNETRKPPTRPGWWWARWNNPHANPTAFFVEDKGGKLWFDARDEDYSGSPAWSVEHMAGHIVWLASIPGPAVLAALAEYSAAFMARDDDARAGGSYANGEVRRERIAADALHAAIRAERDGAV